MVEIRYAIAGGSAQQMRIVSRAGSSASDHREGEWVTVQPAHSAAEALPPWTAQHASVLWLCVRPGATVMRPFHSQSFFGVERLMRMWAQQRMPRRLAPHDRYVGTPSLQHCRGQVLGLMALPQQVRWSYPLRL